MIKNLLWTAPFLFFASGYFITRSLFHINQIQTPSVVGKHLHEAFTLLSNQHLTIRLLDQKEDPDLPHGTVLSQMPAPKQMVKPRQTVFLTLSKQPPITPTPSFIAKQHEAIIKEAQAANLRLKAYYLESPYPTNSCIAQIPAPGQPMYDKTIIIYVAKSTKKPIIWPCFTGIPIDEVVEFLENYQITPHTIDASPSRKGEEKADTPLIIDQRPLPGSLIVLDENHIPAVQLHVQ